MRAKLYTQLRKTLIGIVLLFLFFLTLVKACNTKSVGWILLLVVVILLLTTYLTVIVCLAFGLKPQISGNRNSNVLSDRADKVTGQNNTPNAPFYHDGMSGVEYEKFVCYRLAQMGFRDIQMTKASDDNGADILAVTPDGHTIAIQCKKYKDHIGKHAVQEALAARDYYYRSQAAVITNSVFTRQAKEFANRTGVKLYENFK